MAFCAATPMTRRTAAGSATTSMPSTVARALGGLAERGEDADGGGLAGAVVAEQAEDGAGGDVEVEVPQGPQVAEALAEALGVDAAEPLCHRGCSLFVLRTRQGSSTLYDMATPQRTPRSRGTRDSSFDDIVDRVTEEVTEKVSRKLDQVAEKTKAKIDAAQAKAEAKMSSSGTKLDRQQAKLDRHKHQHADAFERLAAHLDALEVWTRGAGSGRRPRFTRDEIAEAAVRIADAEGFEALSMRRLAAELERRHHDPLPLHPHEGRAPHARERRGHGRGGGPRRRAAAEATGGPRSRSSPSAPAPRIERHPWMLDIVDDPQIGPNAVRHFDQTMQAVAPLGASIEERLDIVTAVDEYVFGYCIHARHNMHPEHEGDEDYASGLVEYIEGLMATGDYPHLEELSQQHSVGEVLQIAEEHSRDPARFRRNLDRLLDGIEADVAKGRRPRKRT